jgi:UDP-GlcNAc:undecaprenyl-phosphate/decaprenyl-phosphate GlcNAc-1-phosphate transferase
MLLPPFIASYLVAIAVTPLAIRIAARTGFLDHPVGYKEHPRATPYLGGAAVFAGFLAGALVYGAVGDSRLTPIFVGAAFLWLVGTIDDRLLLRPRIRVLSVVLAGAMLWYGDLGWTLFASDLANLALTALWVLGIVNAFNLMDNLDGAAASVAAVSAAGIALVAAYEGPEVVTALSVAVCGACIGFLHFNLTRPARIFLGDGGSMLLGFLVAALAVTVWRLNGMAGTAFLPAILLAGLPIFDMTLVIVSRLRRGAPVYKGGVDHTTHRLLPKVGSTWAVALTLAVGQGALSLAAFALMDASRSAMLVGAGIAFVLGVATIVLLDSPSFTPAPKGAAAVDGHAPTPPPRPRQPSLSPSSQSWERASMSTPPRDGATSGKSMPGTGPGP